MEFYDPFVLPVQQVAQAVGGTLDYLRRALLPPAPATEPKGEPYTPPFYGGQCAGVNYRFYVDYKQGSAPATDFRRNIAGSIGDATFIGNDGISDNWGIPTGQGVLAYRSSVKPTIRGVEREDGQPDTCGNIPQNPPPPSISGDGVADSPAPDIEGDGEYLKTGAPLVPSNGFLSALAAIAAGGGVPGGGDFLPSACA